MKEIQHLEYDLKFTEVLPSAPAGFGWHPKGLAIDRSPCGWSLLGPNSYRDPRPAREGKEESTSPRLTVWEKCFSCSFNQRRVQLPVPGQPHSIPTSHQGSKGSGGEVCGCRYHWWVSRDQLGCSWALRFYSEQLSFKVSSESMKNAFIFNSLRKKWKILASCTFYGEVMSTDLWELKNMYHLCITINFYVFHEGCSLYCLLTPGQILSWSQPLKLRCLQPRYSNLPKLRLLPFVLTLPLSEGQTGSEGDVSKASRTWLTLIPGFKGSRGI